MADTGSNAVCLERPLIAVWRAPDVLQLGLEDGALELCGVPRGMAAAISLLSRPRTRGELSLMIPELAIEWIDWLLAQLQGNGLLVRPVRADPIPTTVIGDGKLAATISAALTQAGLSILRRRTDSASAAVDGGFDPAGPVVIADARVEPERALTDRLCREGLAHLLVRMEPDRAVVGPFVVPTRTPCVRCGDLARCGSDPSWPLLLAQLCRHPVEPDAGLVSWAAATAAVQLRAWLAGSVPETSGRCLEVHVEDFRLRSRRWPAQPDCGCCTVAELAPLGRLAG